MSTAAAPVRFSTIGLPEQERVERWEGHNAEALIGLRCRTLQAPDLEATEVNLRVGSLDLARVTGTPHVVERDAALIRRRPSDAVVLYFSLVGEAFFYCEDGVRVLRPGQLLLCDADQAFMRGFSGGLEELVLKLPRSLFGDLAGPASLREPTVLGFGRAGDAHAAALAGHVGRATRAVDPVATDEALLLELVSVLAASSTSGGALPDPAAAHRAAARSYIEAHLTDPSLSAGRVADAVGISGRHLSRLFAEAGSSVPQHVLGRRLERAAVLLRQADAPTVADVAARCGLTSASHFTASFRERFGVRPSDVRREAEAARARGDLS